MGKGAGTRPDGLSLSPELTWWKDRNNSDCHLSTVACAYMREHTGTLVHTYTHVRAHTVIQIKKEKNLNGNVCVCLGTYLAQLVKCLLYQRGDLISDAQNPWRSCMWWCIPVPPERI